MNEFKVLIVGGGMAGLLLGNGLMCNNINFRVYESDPENTERDGFQIRLGALAVAGFKACLPLEQRKKLYSKFGKSGGIVSSAPILYDTKLNVLLDLTKFPAYTKSAPITRAVLRDELAIPLRQAGKLIHRKRFQRYQVVPLSDGGQRIVVTFEDGTEDTCDLLVGADGARSKINRQLGLNNLIHLQEHWNFSAKCGLAPSKLLKLPPEALRAPVAVSYDDNFFFFSAYLSEEFHKVKEAVLEGKATEAAVEAEDTNAGSVFWSLIVPEKKIPSDVLASQDSKVKLNFCLDQVKDWDPRFAALLRVIGSEKVLAYQHHTSTEPARSWRAKVQDPDNPALGNPHVWMIGDAIHAMTPARGMGGNQAMNDTADMLPQILKLSRKAQASDLKEGDFVTGAAEYERAMFPRAFGWVRTSGGQDQSGVDGSTWKGYITLSIMARVLQIAYVYGLLCKALGLGPKDDVPELI